MIAPNLGSEFVPRLSEGAIAISVVRLTGTDLDESIRYNTQMEKAILAAFPDEVEHVWSRIGTAEIATDPMGVELTDMFITLKPRAQWKKARTQAELTDTDRAAPARPARPAAGLFAADRNADERDGLRRPRRPGASSCSATISTCWSRRPRRSKPFCEAIPGTADVTTEQITGQPVLANQGQPGPARPLRRAGAKRLLELVESIGSKPLGEVIEGQLALSAGGAPARTLPSQPRGDRLDPDRHALRRAHSAVAAGRRSKSSRARPRSPANGASGGSPSRPTSAAATWAASWPKHGKRSPTRSHCRRAATASSSAASSSTCSGPAHAC